MALPAALLALFALAVAALAVGSVPLAPGEVWAALAGRGDATSIAIVRSLRLPRVALAALVGAALGMSGAALQGALRNPLAEPYLLGVSGGAAVGAVLALAAGAEAVAGISLGAFGGGAAAVVLVLGIARGVSARADARVLLMAGVVIGAFANAAIMVVLATAPADAARGALWWMMGSVSGASWSTVGAMTLWLAVGGGALLTWGRDADILALGEEPAAGLGMNVDRAARRLYLASSLLAAATVAAAGLVGFVGLVVPHLVRRSGARAHRALFAGSAVAGAALVIAADLVARTARAPAELPLGAVTALIGVPFFLLRLRRPA